MSIGKLTFLLVALTLGACAGLPEKSNPGPTLSSHADKGDSYNRLHAYVRLRLPESIRTVGEATRYYLDTTGFVLTLPRSLDRQPVVANRSRQIVTIEEAIVRLLGNRYRPVVDREYKNVTIEVIPTPMLDPVTDQH
jgi:hypothetical protein